MRLQTAVYYLTYVSHQPALVGAFNGLVIVAVIGNISVPFLSKFMKHRNVMILAMVTFAFGELLMAFKNIPLLFIGNVIALVAYSKSYRMT